MNAQITNEQKLIFKDSLFEISSYLSCIQYGINVNDENHQRRNYETVIGLSSTYSRVFNSVPSYSIRYKFLFNAFNQSRVICFIENKIQSFLLDINVIIDSWLDQLNNPGLSNSAASIDKFEGDIEGILSNNGAPSPFTPNKIDYNQLDLPADKYPIYLESSTLTQNCLNHLSKLNIFTFSALWSFSQDNQYQFFYTDYKKHYPRVLDEIEMILYDMANCHWPRVYKNWV